ncbi:acyltransferase family protein [Maricaulis sp.]|uniref:acyltransferase family protein n=1 Tax=Maricaulis sp. TaxID=1486257 RepID=UPI003A8FD159
MTDKRNMGIDTLRGLACVLLVAFHVIGEAPEHGLRLDWDHPFAMFSALFFHLRMPLFAMLSGFVYAYRPLRRGEGGKFLTGKGRRLVLPYLFAATAFAVVNTVLGGAYAVPLGDFWQVYLEPYAHFWFLHSILTIFLVIAALDWIWPRAPLQVAIGFLVVTSVLFLTPFGGEIKLFSFFHTPYLAPFFALGLVINRMEMAKVAQLPRQLVSTVLIGGLVSMLAVHAYIVLTDPGHELLRRDAVALGLGLCFSGALIMHRFSIAPLAWLGQYSFSIYLYHMFGALGLQMVYNFIGMPDASLGLALGMIAGLGAPVVFQIVTLRVGGFAPLLGLGLKSRRTASPRAAAIPRPASAI